MEINIKLVQQYWDEHPCDSEGLEDFPWGSLEFFEKMEEERYRYQAFIHAFAQFTRWRGKKVLEVGCGCGTDFIQFARTEAKMYGIDLSGRSIELTKKRLELYGLQAEVTQGDARHLPFPSDYFDLVYCWGMLHHSLEPSKVMGEIHRVLKPGGYVKAMVHYRNSPIWLWLWLKYALLRGRIFTSLSRVISEHRESPGTMAFTIKQIKQLFHQFFQLKTQPVPIEEMKIIKNSHFPWLVDFYPYYFGAWMVVEGRKPEETSYE